MQFHANRCAETQGHIQIEGLEVRNLIVSMQKQTDIGVAFFEIGQLGHKPFQSYRIR